jgi:hypothetical protein
LLGGDVAVLRVGTAVRNGFEDHSMILGTFRAPGLIWQVDVRGEGGRRVVKPAVE